jgi:NhaP-type Na+/H+ or K+/H+ antiporter
MKQVKDRSFFWNTIIYLIAAGLFILVLFALPASVTIDIRLLLFVGIVILARVIQYYLNKKWDIMTGKNFETHFKD